MKATNNTLATAPHVYTDLEIEALNREARRNTPALETLEENTFIEKRLSEHGSMVKSIFQAVGDLTQAKTETEREKKAKRLLEICGGRRNLVERYLELYSANADHLSDIDWSMFAIEYRSLVLPLLPSVGKSAKSLEEKSQEKKAPEKSQEKKAQEEKAQEEKEKKKAMERLSREEKAQEREKQLLALALVEMTENGLHLTVPGRAIELWGGQEARSYETLEETYKKDKRSFQELMEKYHTLFNGVLSWSEFLERLETEEARETVESLAVAVARSVLRKMSDPERKTAEKKAQEATDYKKAVTSSGCHPQIVNMYKAIDKELREQTEQRRRQLSETAMIYNENGEAVKPNDRIGYTDTVREGYDLVMEAFTTLLEESKMQLDDGNTVDLEREETRRRLNKRILIQDEPVWKEEEKAPISIAYRSVRHETGNNRSMKVDPECKYMYLSEMVTDEETGEEEMVYRRLKKNSQLASLVDIHGSGKTVVTASASAYDLEKIDSMIEALNLTKPQAVRLNYALRGYGLEAITTAQGLKSKNSVKKSFQQMEKKALASGIFTEEALSRIGEFKTKKELREEIALNFNRRREETRRREEKEARRDLETMKESLEEYGYIHTWRSPFKKYSLETYDRTYQNIAVSMVRDGFAPWKAILYTRMNFNLGEEQTEAVTEAVVKETWRQYHLETWEGIGTMLDKLLERHFQ